MQDQELRVEELAPELEWQLDRPEVDSLQDFDSGVCRPLHL